MKNIPEVTWSLMHPTKLDVEYMRRILQEAEGHLVDSFEICAACHTRFGGMDGLVLYEEFPTVAPTLDQNEILANRQKLKEILNLAHQAGKPVYYWHREVTVWPEILKILPGLLNKNGEFDLLGDEFANLLRYKIRKTYQALPELDGLVLTLTEADFSAIHNSTPEIYPPDKVVERVVNIFAQEHTARKKRFILRSFGSIRQDYEDILAGAILSAKKFSFEVETKITPYDFDPFLPDNPFMLRLQNLQLGAECDCLGEFLGAGYLPAENVRNIVRFVRYGQACNVDRFAIRLDRAGNNIFDTYPINLYAYHQAILHPDLSADEILQHYAEEHHPESCRDTLLRLGQEGFTFAAKAHYIKHNVIFHQFPLKADLKLVKAGGILSLFKNGCDLSEHTGIWSILASEKTPGRNAILQEKEEALALAKRNLSNVHALKTELDPEFFERLCRLWSNAVIAGTGLLAFTQAVCAYYDGMEGKDPNGAELEKIARNTQELFQVEIPQLQIKFHNGLDHDAFEERGNDPVRVYWKPILGLIGLLQNEYQAEFQARQRAEKLPGVYDFILPGAITDDIRCGRFMHASHALLMDGIPVRFIGNQVFPNGHLRMRLKGTSENAVLLLQGKGSVRLEINGQEFTVILDENPRIPLPPASEYTLIFRKRTQEYPLLFSVAILQK